MSKPFTLRKLELFVKKDPARERMVDEYLKRENQLIIDQQT